MKYGDILQIDYPLALDLGLKTFGNALVMLLSLGMLGNKRNKNYVIPREAEANIDLHAAIVIGGICSRTVIAPKDFAFTS